MNRFRLTAMPINARIHSKQSDILLWLFVSVCLCVCASACLHRAFETQTEDKLEWKCHWFSTRYISRAVVSMWLRSNDVTQQKYARSKRNTQQPSTNNNEDGK